MNEMITSKNHEVILFVETTFHTCTWSGIATRHKKVEIFSAIQIKKAVRRNSDIKRHPSALALDNGEINACFPEENKDDGYENVADVLNKVVGEEVDVDRSAKRERKG